MTRSRNRLPTDDSTDYTLRHPGAFVVAPIRQPGRPHSLLWSLGLASTVLVTTLTVLIFGWFLGLDRLVRIFPGFPAMVPSTALNLAMIAVSQIIYLTSSSPRIRRFGTYLAAAAGVYAAFRLGLRVAVLLITVPSANDGGSGDTMAFATALGLMLAAFCTATQDLSDPQIRKISRGASTFGLIMILIAVEGFIFDAQTVYSFFAFAALAIHTAFCLIALFLAVLLAHPQYGWISTLLGHGPGSCLARRMLPVIVIGPSILCGSALAFGSGAPSESAFFLASVTMLLITVSIILLMRCAGSANRASRHMMTEEKQLQAVLDGLPMAVFVLNRLGDIRLTNESARTMVGPDTPPDRWLYDTPFHALNTRAPLRASERPATRLLQDASIDEMTVGYFDSSRSERILNFSVGRITDISGEPLWILATSDETAGRTAQTCAVTPARGDISTGSTQHTFHDIANIIGAIRLSADAGSLATDTAIMKRQFDTIRAACERGVRLAEPSASQKTELITDDLPPGTTGKTGTDSGNSFANMNLAGIRVLIAEDDPLFGEVLTASLRMMGGDISWATNGADALDLTTRDSPFDILITDIRLSEDMNGFELASRMRENSPDVALIYMSGQAGPATGDMPENVIPGTFLHKPVGVAVLANTISQLCAR